MKYLFEMIGLYPATEQEAPLGEESLARTLLQRLSLPEASPVENPVTNDSVTLAQVAGDDAVE